MIKYPEVKGGNSACFNHEFGDVGGYELQEEEGCAAMGSLILSFLLGREHGWLNGTICYTMGKTTVLIKAKRCRK